MLQAYRTKQAVGEVVVDHVADRRARELQKELDATTDPEERKRLEELLAEEMAKATEVKYS